MALASALPTTAAAQLDEIIITAQKREESAQSVGVAVSAFGLEAVERLNARDIRDLAALVPNLVINEVSIGPGLSQISLRGVNSQDPERSFDPAVGVFVDGVYLGTSAFNLLDTFDLEQVEVLRGPQGTLFGRNTTGGAITATRTRPTKEYDLKGSVILGSNQRHDFKLLGNAPLGDKGGIKLAGFYENDNGLWDNPAGGGTGAKDRWAISAGLLFEPNEKFDFYAVYDHSEDDSELTPSVPQGIAVPEALPFQIVDTAIPLGTTLTPAFPADRLCTIGGGRCLQDDYSFTTQTDPHFLSASLDAVTVNSNYDLTPELQLTGIFGWRQSEEAVFIDFDGTDITAFNVVREQDYEQYSGEIRIASSFDGPFNFVAGGFYFNSEYALRQAIKLDLAMVAPIPVLGAAFVNGAGDEDNHESETIALFTQADWEVLDNLKLTAGARVSWDEKTVFTSFFDPPVGIAPTYQVSDGIPAGRVLDEQGGATEDWFEFTPKVGITWQATDNLLTYASFTKGYNAGGFSARAGTVNDVTTPFDPETITAYEIGFKSDFADDRVRLNGAFFFNVYKDKQEEAIQPAPPPTFTSTTVRNVAGAEIWGFEIEPTVLITDELRLDASFGYLNAEYTDHPGFAGPGQYVVTAGGPFTSLVAADFSGLDLRRTPKITFSVTPTYSTHVGPGLLTLATTVRHFGEQQTQFFNSPRGILPSRTFVDAFASFSFDEVNDAGFEIKLFGKNLTDVQDGGGFVNSIVDFKGVSAPRIWGIELQTQF